MTPAERDARAEEFAEAVARAMREDRAEALAAALTRTLGAPAEAVDGHAMLAEGLAAVAAIEADRQARHDRNAAARAHGMALYQQVRERHLRELGMPSELVPSQLARRDLAAYNSLMTRPGAVMGTIPPDPSQTPAVIF